MTMKELLQIFRFDRQTKYYNSYSMMYTYYNKQRAIDAARRKAEAEAARGTSTPTGATAYTSGSNGGISGPSSSQHNPLNTIGRYGTQKRKTYSSSYHSKKSKKGRKKARQKKGKSLQKRYSKLM